MKIEGVTWKTLKYYCYYDIRQSHKKTAFNKIQVKRKEYK